MRAIIKAEGIEVSEEEVKQKLRDPQVRAELEHAVHHNGGTVEDYAYNDMMTDKFFDLLLTNNEFVLEEDATTTVAEPKKTAEAKKPAAKKTTAKTEDKKDE